MNRGRETAYWRVSAGTALLLGLTGGVFAQQDSRMTGLKLSGDQPIQIESDRLEVKQNENIAIFTGNVNVVQSATNLKAGRMIVHYASGGSGGGSGGSTTGSSSEIERIEVDGKVYVKSENQIATGDAGSFNMKTELLELTGKEVVLNDGDNVVTGCKLTVQMATGEANVDGCTGRVKMLLKPQQSQQSQ